MKLDALDQTQAGEALREVWETILDQRLGGQPRPKLVPFNFDQVYQLPDGRSAQRFWGPRHGAGSMMHGRHAALVDIAVAWLRRGVPYADNGWTRCHPLALGEFVSYTVEKPDAIGFYQGLTCVIECKVSRADFAADRAKSHMDNATVGMGRQRWYLTPRDLVSADEVPEWCGLAYARGRAVDVVKLAPRRELCDLTSQDELIVALSAARRFRLGVPFDEKRGRFQTIAEREART